MARPLTQFFENTALVSVIIPAYNEEKVIASSLHPLIPGVMQGLLEIIVVCNGCTDQTLHVVRSFAPFVQCIETPQPGKANALNLGDNAASGFPRIFQDADVILSFEAVLKIIRALEGDQFLAAAPTMEMDFTGASWSVCAYYRVWQQLPYVREGLIGSGVYALSRSGRERFGAFPSIIADDGFVRALFRNDERTIVTSCSSLVRAPSNILGLIKIKTRSRLGGYELRQKFPELLENEGKNYGGGIIQSVRNIRLWPCLPVYFYVNVVSRLRARRQAMASGFTGWERDESSRKG